MAEFIPSVHIAEMDNGIDQQSTRHNQDRHTDTTAAKLRQCQNTDDTGNHMGNTDVQTHLADLYGKDGIKEKCAGAQNHNNDIIPGQMIGFLLPFFYGEDQKSAKDDKCHKGRDFGLEIPCTVKGDI